MINRCEECGEICPDFSNLCDACCDIACQEIPIDYIDFLEIENEEG